MKYPQMHHEHVVKTKTRSSLVPTFKQDYLFCFRSLQLKVILQREGRLH